VLQIEEVVSHLRVFHDGSVGIRYSHKAQWANGTVNVTAARKL
jgi:hypothetical protein